jgi:hypothetical protein
MKIPENAIKQLLDYFKLKSWEERFDYLEANMEEDQSKDNFKKTKKAFLEFVKEFNTNDDIILSLDNDGKVVGEIHKDFNFYSISFSDVNERGKALSFDIHFCNNKL